jgi:CMP-N,N'-diacetyllegionaminic acid synthase
LKVLAVIPARGGSKGIPGKNKYKICGKALIQYTIEVAVSCKLISDIYVSSDDDEILSIANNYNIHLHQRANALATDTSSVVLTVQQVLEVAEAENKCHYDFIILLQPTSPLREPEHITGAFKKLINSEAAGIISVTEMNEIHPARMYNLDNQILTPIIKEYEQLRRQDIPPIYYRNGSIYLVRRSSFLEQLSLMPKPSIPYIMSEDYLLNIDEPRDILVAEVLIKNWLKKR